MIDLIDRQTAITAIFDLCDEVGTENPHVDAIEDTLGNLPPAKSNVIRCKDCKWHRGQYKCLNTDTYGYGLDDFCSLAEPREEAGDSE